VRKGCGHAEPGDVVLPTGPESFAEPHYTPEEIADLWKLSVDAVRKQFQNEPGVLVIEGDGTRYGRRRYRTLRIPASVAERVHRRLSRVGRNAGLTVSR
jgi:hypothetical protein